MIYSDEHIFNWVQTTNQLKMLKPPGGCTA